MKSITLFLTIILAITVSSQAQTTQNNYLKSHVIKKQSNPIVNGILRNNRLTDSLTIKEKLIMTIPISNDFFYRLNTSLKTATAKYFKGTYLKHKVLYSALQSVVKNWYFGTYCRACNWIQMGLQLPLSYRANIWESGGVLLQPSNNSWLQF